MGFLFGVNLTKNVSNAHILLPFVRYLRLTATNRLKEIKVTKEDNTVTIEGVKIASTRTQYLVCPPSKSSNSECKSCPLCRLNLRRLNYTDVLILSQFVESNGVVMPQAYTGLCNRQHFKVKKLVELAQRCQLMTRPTDYVVYGPWDQLNTYMEPYERPRDRPFHVVKPEYWK